MAVPIKKYNEKISAMNVKGCVKETSKWESSNVLKPERSNLTKSIHRGDRCFEDDDRTHNDHNTLHTIADRMGNRGYPLQYHVRNLQAHSQKNITLSLHWFLFHSFFLFNSSKSFSHYFPFICQHFSSG